MGNDAWKVNCDRRSFFLTTKPGQQRLALYSAQSLNPEKLRRSSFPGFRVLLGFSTEFGGTSERPSLFSLGHTTDISFCCFGFPHRTDDVTNDPSKRFGPLSSSSVVRSSAYDYNKGHLGVVLFSLVVADPSACSNNRKWLPVEFNSTTVRAQRYIRS